MEKNKILGIPLTLFIIGILVIGGASAALVSYLSNSTTGTYTVESPFELKNSVGHIEPTSVSEADSESFTSGGAIDFGGLIGTSEIQWTNLIESYSDMSIPVSDFEIIRGFNVSGPLTMDELDNQFMFFGARYWRPEGSVGRLGSYMDDVELGYDPYTYNNSGNIECYDVMDAASRSSDISSTDYVDIRDGICYYVEEAFDFNIVGDDLISDFAYTYPANIQEIAQYTAVLAANTASGTYEYMRQINIPSQD